MLKRLVYLLVLFPSIALGQYRITGKVIDLVSKKPVADASVFLSNASAGAKTNSDGTFTVVNVRGGQYEVIISMLGYETYKLNVLVNKDINLGDIGILQQSIALKEVRIGPEPNWEANYEKFKLKFLGTSDNARLCTILNPHVLSFAIDNGVFTATADGFLEIENKALGYRIKYMLTAFTDDRKTGKLYYEGRAFFEDMKGRKHQMKKWKTNRLQTYLGSDMHFLRSVIANRVPEEKFKVERLIRKPNPDYKGSLDKKYIQTLVTTPLGTIDYSLPTDQKGEYALAFKDCLYVSYNDVDVAGSVINIEGTYAYFDNNGIILNPQDVTMEGKWGENRIAEMLPVDYEPDKSDATMRK